MTDTIVAETPTVGLSLAVAAAGPVEGAASGARGNVPSPVFTSGISKTLVTAVLTVGLSEAVTAAGPVEGAAVTEIPIKSKGKTKTSA